MATRIKASSKGQIVLPKRTRDRLAITSGTELDVIDTLNGVELRPVISQQGLSVDEALARLRTIIRWEGPALPIEELSWHPDADPDEAP